MSGKVHQDGRGRRSFCCATEATNVRQGLRKRMPSKGTSSGEVASCPIGGKQGTGKDEIEAGAVCGLRVCAVDVRYLGSARYVQ